MGHIRQWENWGHWVLVVDGEMLEVVLYGRTPRLVGSGDTNLSETFFWGSGDDNNHRDMSKPVTR